MIDRSAPVVIHDRLGALYPHGDGELIGSIDVDPAVRPASRMSVVFDFGDLDQLVVELDSDGSGRRLFLRP